MYRLFDEDENGTLVEDYGTFATPQDALTYVEKHLEDKFLGDNYPGNTRLTGPDIPDAYLIYTPEGQWCWLMDQLTSRYTYGQDDDTVLDPTSFINMEQDTLLAVGESEKEESLSYMSLNRAAQLLDIPRNTIMSLCSEDDGYTALVIAIQNHAVQCIPHKDEENIGVVHLVVLDNKQRVFFNLIDGIPGLFVGDVAKLLSHVGMDS